MMRSLIAAVVTVSLATFACAGSDGNVRIARDDVGAGQSGGEDNVTQQSPLNYNGRPDAGAIDASTTDATTQDAAVDAAGDAPDDAEVDAADSSVDGGTDADSVDAAIENPCFDVALGKTRSAVKPAPGDLSISEWMADPTAVTDAAGEWMEVRANKDVDLNGLQIGNATLGFPFVVTNCVHVAAGSFAVFARSTDGSVNGLGDVPVAGALPVYLSNASGSLRIGIDGKTLDAVTWSGALGGVSKMIDGNGKQCNAPVSVDAYNGTDIGTPGAANVDCL